VLLVDSSAWIIAGLRPEVLRGLSDESLAVCPPVMQEVLRGSQHQKAFRETRLMFLHLVILDAPTPLERYEQAAQLYIECRDAGVTPRNSFDCLIAATAMAHDATVLHRDADFDHMARVLPLKAQRI
jgi:hypothetical protein